MRRLLFSVLVLSLAACGGGGGGGGGPLPGGGGSGPTPTPCPSGDTGSPPNCTFPQSGTASVSATANNTATATLPPVNGFTGTLQFAASTGAATVTIDESTAVPTGAIALQSALRDASSVRRTLSANTPLLYFTLTSTAAVTFNGETYFTISLPSGVSASQNFYVAQYTTAGWNTLSGPGASTNSTISVDVVNGALGFAAATPIVLAFYAGNVVTPPLTVTPASLQFLDATSQQTLVASESTPGTTFSISIGTCTGIVTAANGSAAGAFVISAVATGTCALTVSDNHGLSLSIPVTVTTTGVVVN